MAGLFQSIQKATVNVARLVHDDVQQLLSCFYWLLVFGLNGLQLLQRESVRLKHVASNALCVDCRCHFVIQRTQYISVICSYTIFDEVKAYKKWCHFGGHPVYTLKVCPHFQSFWLARSQIFQSSGNILNTSIDFEDKLFPVQSSYGFQYFPSREASKPNLVNANPRV